MKKTLLTLLALIFLLNVNAFSQTTIIIPFYKQGENKIPIIENDPCYRKVETKIKEEGLKEADFQFIDYFALVEKIGRDKIRDIGTETDIIKLLVQEAAPDIYIKVDIENYTFTSRKKEYALRINLNAYQSNSARTCAATILDSGRRYYSDCQSLADKAFMNRDETGARKIEVFFQQLVSCMDKPKSVSINFNVTADSAAEFKDKLTNGELLVWEILDWVKKNTKNHKAKSNHSSKIIVIREALLPDNYDTASDYTRDLYSFLTGLAFSDTGESLQFEFDVAGNSITFTLMN